MKNAIKIHIFTSIDYAQEEAWLSQLHCQGWMLEGIPIKGFLYRFVKGTPKQVTYRMDYQIIEPEKEVYETLEQYGWKLVKKKSFWLYFVNEESNAFFPRSIAKESLKQKLYFTRILPGLGFDLAFILAILLSDGYTLPLCILMALDTAWMLYLLFRLKQDDA